MKPSIGKQLGTVIGIIISSIIVGYMFGELGKAYKEAFPRIARSASMGIRA